MPADVSTTGVECDLRRKVQELEQKLAEAHQREKATSEVLGVIGTSPNDVQPVFQAIAERARQLCKAEVGATSRLEGNVVHLGGVDGPSAEAEQAMRAFFPVELQHAPANIRHALAQRAPFQIADVRLEPGYPDVEAAERMGVRSIVSVPLLHEGRAIGTIAVARGEPGRFADETVALLQTFARQAVIAIENTRLFEEVQTRTRELTDSLEYQTATGEVLEVISRSPTNAQPVFDAIAQSAARLCGAELCNVFRFDGQLLHIAASHAPGSLEAREINAAQPPLPPGRGSAAARAIATRDVAEIPDVDTEPDYQRRSVAKAANMGSTMAVPMLKQGQPIGAIAIGRVAKGAFPSREVKLLQTFADQAVIAIENTRLFEAEQASKRELQESLEYQTATSEVLSVISKSPNDLQPVLDAIVVTAQRLCQAEYTLFSKREDDGLYHIKAHVSADPGFVEWVRARPIAAGDGSMVGLVAAGKETMHFPDCLAEPRFTDLERQQQSKARTMLGVPLLHGNEPIGVIFLARTVVHPFTDRQVALVTTFADQAVIAIENTRLFEAEQASKRELRESLEYQTATGEVLTVISRSPTDAQPVFDIIGERAERLCGAEISVVSMVDGDFIRLASIHHVNPEGIEAARRAFPMRRDKETVTARTIRTCAVVHIADVLSDPQYEMKDVARSSRYRSCLSVPMVRDGQVIGAIFVARAEPGLFPDSQVQLLKTFADQAVIAIENTRLFEAEQASKRELQESLEYQMATGKVLGVISSSPNDLQPVLDTIVETAHDLCEADYTLFRRLGSDGSYHVAASKNTDPSFLDWLRSHPAAKGDGSTVGLVAAEQRTIHQPDALADPRFTDVERQRRSRARARLGVPLMHAGEVIGIIFLARYETRPFTDRQIELVTTFADQAVIAIANTRLFDEVQARNRDLTALGEVGRAVSSTLDLKVVLRTIVDRAVSLSDTDGGSIFYFRQEIGRFELGETTGLDEEIVERFRRLDISAGQTGLGEAIADAKPLQVADITNRPSNPLRDAAIEAGLRAALIVPLLSVDGPLGALVLQRRRPGEFAPAVVSLMQSFADQSAIALENARLFNQIAQKSRELEIASQHKSQFVANMSHELRTPLAAILGYAELMQEGFYEPLGQKSMDALTRIRSNGKHLLGLINTVLDIAKIESGQFTLNMGEYAIESVIETVRSATESLAQNKKLALKTEVAKKLPLGLGDEQRLTQVLLNLVGNAIKFTDAGEVSITATSPDGHFRVCVTDTGPGIPADQQHKVFEQFHQVDSSNTKAKGGTGLGLAISKQIVEMHGGRIWVESILGKGSTFHMELPVRAAFNDAA